MKKTFLPVFVLAASNPDAAFMSFIKVLPPTGMVAVVTTGIFK